ncbi:uncharacterized protein LOC130272882 [Hyla sarda]|uniref:uncharacterized protein LOC130272882 n=1 Tax=Hyla sarda TaxID=327740 RepID=UPI0024C22886|nr:uncharacterized protein LOC130272882 [Hyla sarda]
MPSCLVNKCSTKSGKKGQSPDIHLHRFPKDPIRIRKWLQQTGQTFENLERVIELIVEGQKEPKYWLCSLHFDSDCYVQTPNGPVLRQDAIPSNFQGFAEGGRVIEESLKKPRPRGKKRPMMSTSRPDVPSSATSTDSFHQVTDTKYDVTFSKEGFRTIGTQTESTISNSTVEYLAYDEQKREISSLCREGPAASTPVAQTGKLTLMNMGPSLILIGPWAIAQSISIPHPNLPQQKTNTDLRLV